MRAEIVRLVFSLSLVGVAFLAGIYVGWRRWGLRPEPEPPGVRFTTDDVDSPEPATAEARRDLFAPASDVIDLRFAPAALPGGTVVRAERSLPRAAIVADEIVIHRSDHDPRRAD